VCASLCKLKQANILAIAELLVRGPGLPSIEMQSCYSLQVVAPEIEHKNKYNAITSRIKEDCVLIEGRQPANAFCSCDLWLSKV